MELSFFVSWAVLFGLQIKPAEWLLNEFIKDKERGGVGIFAFFVVLPITSSLGAEWVVENLL